MLPDLGSKMSLAFIDTYKVKNQEVFRLFEMTHKAVHCQ
jgi:hypothetical protein